MKFGKIKSKDILSLITKNQIHLLTTNIATIAKLGIIFLYPISRKSPFDNLQKSAHYHVFSIDNEVQVLVFSNQLDNDWFP